MQKNLMLLISGNILNYNFFLIKNKRLHILRDQSLLLLRKQIAP